MLGIAKLLPQIVPVKRETLQVVSLAMTGLMRGCGLVFHIVENGGAGGSVTFRQNDPSGGPSRGGADRCAEKPDGPERAAETCGGGRPLAEKFSRR